MLVVNLLRIILHLHNTGENKREFNVRNLSLLSIVRRKWTPWLSIVLQRICSGAYWVKSIGTDASPDFTLSLIVEMRFLLSSHRRGPNMATQWRTDNRPGEIRTRTAFHNSDCQVCGEQFECTRCSRPVGGRGKQFSGDRRRKSGWFPNISSLIKPPKGILRDPRSFRTQTLVGSSWQGTSFGMLFSWLQIKKAEVMFLGRFWILISLTAHLLLMDSTSKLALWYWSNNLTFGSGRWTADR